jgi:hypothetical protein
VAGRRKDPPTVIQLRGREASTDRALRDLPKAQ